MLVLPHTAEALAHRQVLLRDLHRRALAPVVLASHKVDWIYGEEKETATGLVKAEKRREQKQLRAVCLRPGPLAGIYSYEAKRQIS